jgi:hypothetical protein
MRLPTYSLYPDHPGAAITVDEQTSCAGMRKKMP